MKHYCNGNNKQNVVCPKIEHPLDRPENCAIIPPSSVIMSGHCGENLFLNASRFYLNKFLSIPLIRGSEWGLVTCSVINQQPRLVVLSMYGCMSSECVVCVVISQTQHFFLALNNFDLAGNSVGLRTFKSRW